MAFLASGRAIIELGNHLLDQVNRLEPTLANDLRLDPFGLLARLVLTA